MSTPNGMFWCDYCESYQPEAEMGGDDEPICQNCYVNRLDSYKDAFDDMAGRPLEAVDALVRGVAKMTALFTAVTLTREEAETAWNAMEYAFEALDGDMSLSFEDRAELRRLEELKDRIKGTLDAQQGRNGGE